MLRSFSAVVAIAFASLSAAPAHAQWFTRTYEGCKHIFRVNNDWPYPYVLPDREAVALPMGIETANGWRRQNLVQDYHFDDQMQLNNAGEAKIRWVLTQAPQCRRTLFVLRGDSDQITNARIFAMRQYANRFLPPGMVPEIIEYGSIPYSWPADEIDGVYRRYQSSAPNPRISSAASPGTAPAFGSSGGGTNPNAGPAN